jgi:hypothetical protein
MSKVLNWQTARESVRPTTAVADAAVAAGCIGLPASVSFCDMMDLGHVAAQLS